MKVCKNYDKSNKRIASLSNLISLTIISSLTNRVVFLIGLAILAIVLSVKVTRHYQRLFYQGFSFILVESNDEFAKAKLPIINVNKQVYINIQVHYCRFFSILVNYRQFFSILVNSCHSRQNSLICS